MRSETRNHIHGFLRKNYQKLEKIAPLSFKRTSSGSQKKKKQSILPGYYSICNSVTDIGEFSLVVGRCVYAEPNPQPDLPFCGEGNAWSEIKCGTIKNLQLLFE